MVRADMQRYAVCVVLFLYVLINPTAAKTQEHSLWQDLGLYGGQIKTLAVDPQDSRVLYAGSWGGDGLFKSTDAGETWFGIPEDNPSWFRNYEVYDIAVDPNNPLTVWVADNYFIDVSRDGGATWQTFFFAKDERRFCYTVAVDPHDPTGDTVYVGTGGPDYADEYGEIFVTGDGGVTWDKMNIAGDIIWHNFWKIAFNPNSAGEVWVANRKSYLSPDGLIIFSPDYGQSWWYWDYAYWPEQAQYYSLGYIDEVLVHPEDPLKIFASSQYGIARKLDGSNLETHWVWTPVMDSCRALCIPPAAPDTIYAGLLSTIAKSTDCGATWDESRASPAEFLSLQADPDDAETLYAGSVNRGVFKTGDGAVTWEPVNTGIKANTIYDSAVAAQNAARVVCGTLAGVYLTTDLKTWDRVYNSSAESVALHPNDAGVIYAGTGFGTGWEILKSRDSGSSWIYISSDIEEESEISSIAVIPSATDNDSVVAGVAYGSGKKGEVLIIKNWGYRSYDQAASVFETTVPVNAVAVHPVTTSLLFAGSGSFFAPVAPGGLYLSRNGGATWTKALPFRDVIVNSITIAPSNPDSIYVGCGGSNASYAGIFKSTDAGATWAAKTAGLPASFSVRDIMIDRTNSDIVYAVLYKGYNDTSNNLGGTYVTLDGGSYWTRVGLSDYRMYDINTYNIRPELPARSVRLSSGSSVSLPSSVMLAGTASGMYQSTTAGNGIISGAITSDTGLAIEGAMVATAAGSGGQSVEGYYLLMLPAGVHSLQVMAPGYTPVVLPSVAVGAGQSVEQHIVMTAGSTDNNTNCLATRMLDIADRDQKLTLLRTIRDAVLGKTPVGRLLIEEYYALGPELWQVLQHNPGLRRRCAGLMTSALAFARSLRAGTGGSIPPGCMDSLSALLIDLEAAAPAPLRARVSRLRGIMRHLNPDAAWSQVEPGDPHP